MARPSRSSLATISRCAPAGRRARLQGDARRTPTTARRLDRFVVEVDDLESKVAELKEAGLSFRNEIVSGPAGKQIVLEDGDGKPRRALRSSLVNVSAEGRNPRGRAHAAPQGRTNRVPPLTHPRRQLLGPLLDIARFAGSATRYPIATLTFRCAPLSRGLAASGGVRHGLSHLDDETADRAPSSSGALASSVVFARPQRL